MSNANGFGPKVAMGCNDNILVFILNLPFLSSRPPRYRLALWGILTLGYAAFVAGRFARGFANPGRRR